MTQPTHRPFIAAIGVLAFALIVPVPQVKIIPAPGGGGGSTVTGGTCASGTYTVSIDTSGVPTCSAVPPTTTTQSTSRATTLVTGGQVAWSSAFTFRVSAATYYIEGIEYTSTEQTVSMAAADGTNPRLDVIALDDTGTVVAITGTAATTPSEPGIDTGSQLKLALVSVPANATVAAVSNTVLYAENAGSTAEWNWTTSGSGFTLASTTNPHAGTKDIEGTTVANNAYAQGAIGSGSIQAANIERLVFFIRSKATWANKRVLKVQLQSTGVIVGNVVTISTGAYGFDSSVTSGYQQVVVPMVHFAVPASSTFNQIRFTDSGGSIGFYLDDISLQGGIAATQSLSGLTQDQADARYYRYKPTYDIGNSSTAFTADWNNSNAMTVTMTGNATATFSNPVDNGRYIIYITQGSGGHVITWPSTVKWAGGAAQTLSTAAGARDLCTFAYVGPLNIYFAACNLDIH